MISFPFSRMANLYRCYRFYLFVIWYHHILLPIWSQTCHPIPSVSCTHIASHRTILFLFSYCSRVTAGPMEYEAQENWKVRTYAHVLPSVYKCELPCIVLYCIVLYCIVLYCIVLYCIVLYCIVLYCIVLYCIVLMNCHNTSLFVFTHYLYSLRLCRNQELPSLSVLTKFWGIVPRAWSGSILPLYWGWRLRHLEYGGIIMIIRLILN